MCSNQLLPPTFSVITEIHETSAHLFGSITDFCRELAILCKENGYGFYVTSILHLLSEPRQGYSYNGTNWIKENVSLPAVLHNRIHNRFTEHSTPFTTLVHLLQQENIPFFNEHFLHKWEIHEILSDFLQLEPFLPTTTLFRKKENLLQMLENYEYIFIKPIYGSQGRNIFRVYKKNDIYHTAYNSYEGKKEYLFHTFDELFQNVKKNIGNKPYILQQGLHLLTYHNKSLDFRVLTHKKSAEKWAVTSIVARVSAENEFVSNIARGGEIKTLQEILLHSFGTKKALETKKVLYELAVNIATCLDTSLQGFYGEFGIDIALDVNGSPWMIEVNTKPSKNFLPSQSTIVRPSSKALLAHFQYLSRFNGQ